ncbi:MAG: type II secretion system protein N [Glaciecola sp.]
MSNTQFITLKKWQWIILAILTYLLFLIAYTPATLVAHHINKQSGNQVQLSGVSGTLFEGYANTLSMQGLRVNQVKWELSPLSLLGLSPSIDMQGGNIRDTNGIYVKGTVSTSLLDSTAIEANQVQLFVPTKTVLAQLTLPVFVTASGRFRVDINTFQFDQGCAQLQGKGSWLNAAVNVNNNPISFGTFEANLSCQTPNFIVEVSPSNKLSLDAQLNIDMSGKYKVEGRFKVPSDLPKEIQQAAQFFGNPSNDGYYNITL